MVIFRRLRILPLLVIVASLCFTVRLSAFFIGLDRFGSLSAMAAAPVNDAHGGDANADAASPLPDPMPAMADGGAGQAPDILQMGQNDATQGMDVAGTGEHGAQPGGVGMESGAMAQGTPGTDKNSKWQDASESDYMYSDVQAELYQDLSARRRELDQREKELATRAALLEAAERELDQKLRELTAVQNRIEGMMEKQNDEQADRIASLVKIYEGMKAKEAARIFDTLDMEILIRVMSKMSERKLSPILAAMNPERARAVTILLAQKNQLPTIQ